MLKPPGSFKGIMHQILIHIFEPQLMPKTNHNCNIRPSLLQQKNPGFCYWPRYSYSHLIFWEQPIFIRRSAQRRTTNNSHYGPQYCKTQNF